MSRTRSPRAGETPAATEALSWPDVGPVDLGSLAHFEKAECMFQRPQGMPRGDLKVECGYLTVPEDRSQDGSLACGVPESVRGDKDGQSM